MSDDGVIRDRTGKIIEPGDMFVVVEEHMELPVDDRTMRFTGEIWSNGADDNNADVISAEYISHRPGAEWDAHETLNVQADCIEKVDL